MSQESLLVDDLLAKITAAVASVTVRNAISEGFLAESDVGLDILPFAQGFSVDAEVDAGDFGQELRLYTIQCFMVRAPDQAEQMWTDINGIRVNLFADYHLGGTVNRAWLGAYAVDERGDSDRERTIAGLVFQVEVVV